MSEVSKTKQDQSTSKPDQYASKPDKSNLRLKTLPRRIVKDKVTTIGHVFHPNIIEQQSKLFHLRYSPKDDCYYQLGSNTASVKGWRNGTNVAVNVMRRIGRRADIDLQWAYLTRYPGRQSGSISWKFDFTDSGLVVDDVTALTYSRTSPGGLVRYDIVSPDTCFNDVSSAVQGDSNGFSGLKTLILVAYLDGIKTNQTQTQLLYHEWSTNNEKKDMDDKLPLDVKDRLPLEIIIKLKTEGIPQCTCPEGDSNNKQLQCTCLKDTANNFIPMDSAQLCNSNNRNLSRSAPSLVELKCPSSQSADVLNTHQDGFFEGSKNQSKYDEADDDEKTKKSSMRFGSNGLQYSQSFNDCTIRLCDTPTTNNSQSQHAGVSRSCSDTPTTNNSQSQHAGVSRSCSDTPTTNNSQSQHASISRSCSDTPTTNNSLSQHGSVSRSLSNTPIKNNSISQHGSVSRLCDTPIKNRTLTPHGSVSRLCDKPIKNQSLTPHGNVSKPKLSSSRSETALKIPDQPQRSLRSKHSRSESKLRDISCQPASSVLQDTHSSIPHHRLPPLEPLNVSPNRSPNSTTKRKPRKRLKISTKTSSPGQHRRRKKPTRNQHQKLSRSNSAPLNHGYIDDDVVGDVCNKPPSAGPSPSRVTIAKTFAAMSVIDKEKGASGGVCSVKTKKVLFTKDLSLAWDGDTQGHTDGRKIDKEALVTIDCSEVDDNMTSPTRTATCHIL
ncbi:uncharacterized protein [Amphiura filiformis]|uniref:uncharacterized protein n=1 Tax=Amphiura filiformis TaxID=82378 RepID=UPI003B21FE07